MKSSKSKIMRIICAKLGSVFCLLTVFFSFSYAEVKMPSIFSDNMVLQQKMDVPIWGWAKPDSKIEISASWLTGSLSFDADNKGEWRTKISTPEAGGPYTITISDGENEHQIKNVLVGEVWFLSGQSNMEMPLKGYKSQPIIGGNDAIVKANSDRIRMITVPRNGELTSMNDFKGAWEVSSPQVVSNFSAIGWFFAEYITNALDVPVGLIESAYGGSNIQAWMSSQMLQDFNEIEIPQTKEDVKVENRTATVLYHAMLKPVLGYGIKGILWYQGESNVNQPTHYEDLLVKMVDSWREEWGQDNLDFYFAQIAPYNYGRYIYDQMVGEDNGAQLREEQRRAAKRISDGGMIVLMDVGEQFNIHPPKKQEVASRFAYQALAQSYGLSGFESKSPDLEKVESKDSELVLTFSDAPNGLILVGDYSHSFMIAGEDKIFYSAEVKISGNKLTLKSTRIKNPVAARYAFQNYEHGTLFSSGGLPVSSFKTDDW